MVPLKVTRIGNSLGIVLPKEVALHLKVEANDNIYLTESPDGYRITPYNPEFKDQMEIAQKIMKEDRDVLRELAK